MKIVMAISKEAFEVCKGLILNTWFEDEEPVLEKAMETDTDIICTFQSEKAVDFYTLGKLVADFDVDTMNDGFIVTVVSKSDGHLSSKWCKDEAECEEFIDDMMYQLDPDGNCFWERTPVKDLEVA